MAIENSENGILTIDAATEALVQKAMAAEEEATEEVEVADEAEEVEEVELSETDEVEFDGESEEAEEDDATLDDEDTDDDIDAEELNKGYLRQQDYTRKTQALAEKERVLEAQKAAFQSQAQQELANLKAAIDAYTVPTEAEPNWSELARTKKPEEYQQIQADWADKQAKAQQALELKQRIDDAEAMQTREREQALLMSRIPEWADQTVLQSDLSAMGPVAMEYGITQEELAGIVDHRQIAMLRDFAILKRGQKKVAQKKAKPTRKVAAPAAPNKVDPVAKRQREASARLKKSGNVNDAVEAFLAKSAK